MPRDTMTPLELANVYAKYYVEDFAGNVMRHLKGSHAIPDNLLDSLVSEKLTTLESQTNLSIENSSVVGRFLFECAEFALEHNLADVDSRQAWEQTSALPSAHHAELNTIVYASADLYRSTLDQTVIGTIAKDADTTAKLIAQAAQSRTSMTETGGSFNLFSWGILNDGLWLNNALVRASDRAQIFKADQSPVVSWATQAFNFAHQGTSFAPMNEDARVQVQAEINLLLGNVPEETLNPLLSAFSQLELNDLLCRTGTLASKVDDWDEGRRSPQGVIQSISEMSVVARLLDLVRDASQLADEDTEISDTLRSRLERAYESVTMSLVAYEALRETRFSDTLIMSVKGEGPDPKVDVFVNGDTITNYRAAHGEDSDLVRFGLHLDPRQGMPAATNGWSLQYVLDRKDNVLPKIMAEDAERLEQLRRNDASVIRSEATRITREVVQSYLSARHIDEVSPTMHQAIGRLSREITNEQATISLDKELTSLLATAHGDPFVQKATSTFVNHLQTNGDVAKYASAATIVNLAIDDAVDYITSSGNQEF